MREEFWARDPGFVLQEMLSCQHALDPINDAWLISV